MKTLVFTGTRFADRDTYPVVADHGVITAYGYPSGDAESATKLFVAAVAQHRDWYANVGHAMLEVPTSLFLSVLFCLIIYIQIYMSEVGLLMDDRTRDISRVPA